jgi:hypothetical protein
MARPSGNERTRRALMAKAQRRTADEIDLAQRILAVLFARRNGRGLRATLRAVRAVIACPGELWLAEARRLDAAWNYALATVNDEAIATACNGRRAPGVN